MHSTSRLNPAGVKQIPHKCPDEIFIVSSRWSEDLLQVDDGFLLLAWGIIEKYFIHNGL